MNMENFSKGPFALDNFYLNRNLFHCQQWQYIILSLSYSVNGNVVRRVTQS